MAYHVEFQRSIVLKEFCDLRERGVGFGLDLRLPGVEVYAVYRNVAGRVDVVAHRSSISNYFLLHRFFFDDKKFVSSLPRLYLDPCFPAVLLEHDRRSVAVLVKNLAPDLGKGVLDVPHDLKLPWLCCALVENVLYTIMVAFDRNPACRPYP